MGREQGGVSEDVWGPGAGRVVRWGQEGLGWGGLVSAVHAAVWAFGVSASSAWGPQRQTPQCRGQGEVCNPREGLEGGVCVEGVCRGTPRPVWGHQGAPPSA